MKNKAWIYFPTNTNKIEIPFLVPTNLKFENSLISRPHGEYIAYQKNGLPHLKVALVKAALNQWDAPVLRPYKDALKSPNSSEVGEFVQICAVFFLAGVLGDVRKQLIRKFPDFGSQPEDFMAVNLAVPVADAQRPEVEKLYQTVLNEAWQLSDQIVEIPQIDFKEIGDLISVQREKSCSGPNDECFIYPEVSANVQGFVRSRASSPGIYLFSDAGAGTVDQGVFIYFHQNEKEHLTYLHGNVLPEGSSLIENLAATASGLTDVHSLEKWRKRKEFGERFPELQSAKNQIRKRLHRGTSTTLAWARKKLYVEKQLQDLRVIFGGGGHCDMPYKVGVMDTFSKNFNPDIVGMPIPLDLELGPQRKQWIRRLSVAYGLSFVRTDLTGFTYPKDLKDPDPSEIIYKFKKIPEAPTKDVC